VSTRVLAVLVRVFEQHSAAVSLPLFLLLIAGAYWWYAVAPYRKDRPCDLRAPEHVCRPAVPGVLENWASEPAEADPTCPPARTDPAAPMETNRTS
jgi:hypothetical protein